MKNKINNLISLFGKKFGFDAHYFTKNTFWLLVGQGMMSVAAFLSTVVLANYVSKHDVGDYRLIVSIYATITFFSLPGVGVSLLHSIVNNNNGALLEAVSIKKRYGLIAFFVGTLIALYFGVFKNNPVFGFSIFVMSVCLPIIETYSLYSIYLQGLHKFKQSSINTGLVKIISSIAIIVVVYFNPSTIYLIFAFYLSQAVVTFIQYKILIKKFPLQNDIKDDGMLPYARHFTFAGALSLLFGQADKFILYHFFGPVSLAQYWIASTVPQEVGRVMYTVSQVAYPKLIKGDHQEMKKWLPKKLFLLTLVLIGVSFLYSLIAYPFFNLFFPQYIDSVPMSMILMFASVVTPYTFVWLFYTAKRHVKVTYISNIVEPILQVILYIIFIPLFGVWGLVSAVFIKSIIMNIFSWYILRKY